jgi:hypothetical protein
MNHPQQRSVALALTALCLAPSVWAAEEPIVTDRPDFVESSDVVGKGRFQIETSLAFERNKVGGLSTRTRSTPTLLRIGTGEDWELRLETDGKLRERQSQGGISSTERGWADVALGVKWHQQDGDEASGRPGMGWLFHVDLDSGSAAFKGQGLRPSLRFVAEWEMPGGWTAGVMPGVFWDRNDEGKRFAGGILAGVLGKSFNERTRGFVELSAQRITTQRNGGNVLSFDTGAAYLLTNDVQLDAALSRGLNKNTPDWSFTVGLSARY